MAKSKGYISGNKNSYAKGFIEGMKTAKGNYIVAEMLAEVAKVLSVDTNLDIDGIKEILVDIQQAWEFDVANGVSILADCYEKTGLDFRNKECGVV